MMDVLLQDLRYAWRALRRAPGYSAVVAIVMALGIGVNVMMYGLYHAILLRPLPLPDPERIVQVGMSEPKRNAGRLGVSWQTFHDLRDQAQSFDHLGAFWDHIAIVTLDQDPERLRATNMTADVLPALGVKPALGRGFTRDEEVWGRNWSQVMISDRIWRDRYGSDPRVLGRTLKLDGRIREIVGVMPPGIRFPETQDFFIPAGFDAATAKRTDQSLSLVARMKQGVRVKQAEAEVDAIIRALGHRHPELEDFGGQVQLARLWWVGGGRTVLTVLLVAVVFVLLIASLNVANLMLARAAGRRREVHLRLALGASRWRVVRQLLTESVLISLVGGAIGVALGQWGLEVLNSTIPVERPFYVRFIVDGPVLLYAAGITILAGITFGIAPAIRGTDVRISEALRSDSGQAGTSRQSLRLRNALVIAEVALSLVLVIGAGLMVRTLVNLENAGARMQTEGIVTARTRLSDTRYDTPEKQRRFFHELVTRLEADPAIARASGASVLPLGQVRAERDLVTPLMRDPAKEFRRASFCQVMPGALETMDVRLVAGRWFTVADDERAPRVAMVSQSFATRLFPGVDPIGQRLRYHDDPESLGWRTIVGVVQDVVLYVDDVSGRGNPLHATYVPAFQEPLPRMSLIVQSRGDTDAAAAAIRAALRGLDPELVAEDVRTLPEEFRFRLWLRRLYASLLGVCAVLAFVIAVVGLYGVMAYSVAQRTREIGIRMALGAQATAVQRMVVNQALRLTLTGIVLGLAGAFALTRFMASIILGVSPTDPPTFVLVTSLLALSGLLAAWVPAHRAVRVNPVVALRHE